MEVKPGYKQTEVGVIPDDWRLISVSQVGETKRGAGSQYIKYRASGGVRLIRINDFFENAPVFVEPTDAMKRYLIHERDLLFAGTGASAGASYLPDADWIGLPHSYNAPRIRISESQSKEYVLFSLQSSYVLKQQKAWFVGAAQPFLDTKAISNLLLAIPPTLPEQRAVAGALSDVDALIGALDSALAKKRDLKQAAMQQLLTGQKRLPGFHGEWEVKKIGELLKYERPDKYLVKSVDYQDNAKTPVLTANKSFVLGYTNEDFGIYDDLPAIIFDDFTTDSKFVDFPFKVKSSAIKILKTRGAETNLKFVYERMRLVNFPLGEHKRYYISEYQYVEILTPKSDEQTAIAEVLSDMDAELAALEQRRDKTRALKQGMMQELLTGRVRLTKLKIENG